MHLSRIVALVGVLAGIVGLFFTSLTTDGADLLPTLNAANPAFPDGLPTIWGGLDTWAQIVLVILIIVVIALAVMPTRTEPLDRNSALIVLVIGFALMVYAIIKWADASDSADNLAGAFAQAAGGGLIPVAFDVAPGPGFIVLTLGTIVVQIGAVLSLMKRN